MRPIRRHLARLPALLLALTLPLPAQSLHLGSRDIHAGGLGTVEVPVLLTNFGQELLTSVEFTLNYPSGTLAFAGVGDSTNAPGFTVQPQEAAPGALQVRLDAPTGGNAAEWLHLTTLRFAVQGTPAGDSLRYAGIRLNEGDATVATTPFAVLSSVAPGKGDANGDGVVDFADVKPALDAVASGSGSDVLDLNGNGQVEVHDVGLLYRHALGLMPGLLKEAGGGGTPSREPEFSIGAPKSLGSNLYAYVVTGRNLQNLIAADILLRVDALNVERISRIRFAQGPIVKTEKSDPDGHRVLMASPVPVDSGDLDWMEIIAEHKPGATGQGVELPFPDGWPERYSGPVGDLGLSGTSYGIRIEYNASVTLINTAQTRRRYGTVEGVWKDLLRFPNPDGSRYRLLITDAQGRSLLDALVLPGPDAAPPALELAPGRYLLRLLGPSPRRLFLGVP